MGRKNVTVVQRHRNEGSAVWYARVRDVATGKVRYVSMLDSEVPLFLRYAK